MALSKKASEAIRRAVTEDSAAEEIQAALEAGANPQADEVAEMGTTTDLSAATVATGGTPDCDAAAVEAAIDAVAGEVEDRLDAIEAKMDELLAALKAAGLMAS